MSIGLMPKLLVAIFLELLLSPIGTLKARDSRKCIQTLSMYTKKALNIWPGKKTKKKGYFMNNPLYLTGKFRL